MNEINRFLAEYFSDERLRHLLPLSINVDESVTIQPLDPVAFALNSATGYTQEVTGEEDLPNGVLVRAVVPYVVKVRMEDNATLRLFYFSVLINSMLTAATKAVGDLSFRRISINRPGDGNYLRELETTAGYEFRLFVYPEENEI